MDRPGVMAPPTLYNEPARPGLMSLGAAASPPEIDLRAALWSVVAVLGAVELCLELALP
jgi:hypothetical protein